MLSIIAVCIDNVEINRRFVSSIREYTTGKYELILIDNGSKDKAAINFFKKNADVYHRFVKMTDLAKAWNKGIQLSKGKYVAVVNNDTVVPPKWNERLISILQSNKSSGMVSPMTLWLIKSHFSYKNLRNFDNTFTKPFKLIKNKDAVFGEFCLFKRKALQSVGGYLEIYPRASGEDLEMVFQLYKKGYDIFVDPRVFVYHQGGGSQTPNIISKKDRKKYWTENYKLFQSRWWKYTKDW